MRGVLGRFARHCESRSDEAIHGLCQLGRFYVIGALWLTWSSAALGEGTWLPKNIHLNGSHLAEDCRLIRALRDRAKVELADTQQTLKIEEALLKKRRLALEVCGRQKGMKGPLTALEDTQLASFCPDQYKEWLSPSYRFYALKEDLLEVEGNVQKMQDHLERRCAFIREGRMPSLHRVAAYGP